MRVPMVVSARTTRFAMPWSSPRIRIYTSVLGPAGLLFLLLSSSGRLSKLNPLQQAVLVGALAAALELVQLCPRPGFLRYVHYTFDYLDLIASVLSISAAYAVAVAMITRSRS